MENAEGPVTGLTEENGDLVISGTASIPNAVIPLSIQLDGWRTRIEKEQRPTDMDPVERLTGQFGSIWRNDSASGSGFLQLELTEVKRVPEPMSRLGKQGGSLQF